MHLGFIRLLFQVQSIITPSIFTLPELSNGFGGMWGRSRRTAMDYMT
jgi:hypothetical protein